MALSAIRLTGFQNAQFERASKFRVWLFLIQLLLAVPAAIAVLVEDGAALYWLALAGAVLVIIWWLVEARYRRYREGAQTARRAALIAHGLGGSFSAGEVLSIRQKLRISESAASAAENRNYYASRLPAGPGRLAELIEESAFYTAELQRISASIMRLIVALFALLFVVTAFCILPYAGPKIMMTLIRISFAFLVFVLSSDVFGAMRRHGEAATSAAEVCQRLCRARADGYPLNDVLLALSDYNAIIEAAPESVPYAYGLSKGRLNDRWEEYQAACWTKPQESEA